MNNNHFYQQVAGASQEMQYFASYVNGDLQEYIRIIRKKMLNLKLEIEMSRVKGDIRKEQALKNKLQEVKKEEQALKASLLRSIEKIGRSLTDLKEATVQEATNLYETRNQN